MTRDERDRLNKFIHETVLEQCWGEDFEERLLTGEMVSVCCKCGGRGYIHKHPDYTSESSPRSLLGEAEKKCIEKVGIVMYARCLGKISFCDARSPTAPSPCPQWDEITQIATMPAKERCLAIEAAWRTK